MLHRPLLASLVVALAGVNAAVSAPAVGALVAQEALGQAKELTSTQNPESLANAESWSTSTKVDLAAADNQAAARATPATEAPAALDATNATNATPAFAGVKGRSPSGLLIASIVVIALAVAGLAFELIFPVKPWSETFAAIRGRKAEKDAGSAAESLAKSEKSDEEEVKEEDLPADPNRWTVLGFILTTVASNDLYFNMPGTFFQGEAAKKGPAREKAKQCTFSGLSRFRRKRRAERPEICQNTASTPGKKLGENPKS
mgnify:CR=1 FL=1